MYLGAIIDVQIARVNATERLVYYDGRACVLHDSLHSRVTKVAFLDPNLVIRMLGVRECRVLRGDCGQMQGLVPGRTGDMHGRRGSDGPCFLELKSCLLCGPGSARKRKKK